MEKRLTSPWSGRLRAAHSGAAQGRVRFHDMALSRTIYTVNSRSHVLLEVLRDHYGLVGERMTRQIGILHDETVAALAAKSIDYKDLRSALTPTVDRHEALFLFDSQDTGSNLYGRDIFNHLLPLLDPRTTQSILVGDLIGRDKTLILEILRESMVLSRSFNFKHSTLLYGVYLNNLSETMLLELHKGLSSYSAYLGHIPTTFLSRAKIYASTTLAGFILKHGKTLIVAHEDDRPNTEDINITFYHLEQCGYRVRSLQSSYFDIFLKFKIERPVMYGDTADVEISLNAISKSAQTLGEFKVLLDEDKHGYLINEKLGKLRKAGLDNVDRASIESVIQSKTLGNYIYNLTYLHPYDLMKFNIMIEVERLGGYPTRMMVALEYMPEQKTLRVITLN